MEQISPKQHRIGMLQMILAASLWSIAGIFIKHIPWNPIVITGGRGVFAGLVTLVYLRAARVRFRLTWSSFLAGFFQAGMGLCFVVATKLTTSANAIVLQYVSPLFLMGFSVLFFKEKFHLRDLLVAIAALLGVTLSVLGEMSPTGMVGNLIALAAGIFAAGRYLTAAKCSGEERLSGLLIGHILTVIAGAIAMCFAETPMTFKAISFVAILGVFQLGLPFIICAAAQKRCTPLECNLLAIVEPLLNPVWVFLFDGEAPSLMALVGSVIVIGSVALWTLVSAKKSSSEEVGVRS